jgi:hypothetical protein
VRRLGRARVLAAAACTLALLAAGEASEIARTPPPLDAALVIGPERPDIRRLGQAVAADGGLLAVAAPTDGDDALSRGFVSIHRMGVHRDGSLAVRAEQTVVSNAPAPGDHFGASVSVIARCADARGADLLAIGADRANAGGSEAGAMAGAVEIFERVTDEERPWRPTARLCANAPEPGASFGAAIAFDRAQRARIAVGAPRHDAVGAFDAGRVHVFQRTASSTGAVDRARWTEVASLSPPTPRMSMWFGAAVALDGEFLAVASPGDDVATEAGRDAVHAAGAVYLYRQTGGGGADSRPRYRLDRVLTAPVPEPSAWFGLAVALDDGVLAVGVPRARDTSEGAMPIGCVYLFDLDRPDIAPKRIDPPEGPTAHGFGQVLALRDGLLVIGAPSADAFERDPRPATVEDAGAAWVYSLARGGFDAALNAPRPLPSGLFGSSCALGAVPATGLAPVASAHTPLTQQAIAIIGHLFVEEESVAPSRGAALFALPTGHTGPAAVRREPAPP